jgi:hypothetical protein
MSGFVGENANKGVEIFIFYPLCSRRVDKRSDVGVS